MIKNLKQKIATFFLMSVNFKKFTTFQEKKLHFLIKNGADVNYRFSNKTSIGEIAILENSTPGLNILIDAGLDVNTTPEGRLTLLELACSTGKRDIAKTLMIRGSNINAHQAKSIKLMIAYKQLHLLQFALTHGADMHLVKQQLKNIPILTPDKVNHIRKTVEHVENLPQSPLEIACYNENDEVVKNLCKDTNMLATLTPMDWENCLSLILRPTRENETKALICHKAHTYYPDIFPNSTKITHQRKAPTYNKGQHDRVA